MTIADLHLGYSAAELADSPYREFYRPELAPLAEPVREALLIGAQAPELLYPFERAGELQTPGYWPVETGFSLAADGAARISVLTQMPAVTPAMWDWWFAWHGSEAQRYKLWHPRAHVHAAWADGRRDLPHYVGRLSRVVEYVGAQRLALDIRFVSPASVGLDEARLAVAGEVAICARGSLSGTPLESGWLIHHVRPVPGGAEMRSRFWLGGENVCLRGMPAALGRLLGRGISRLQRPDAVQAADLLVHCAEEMNHLAAILPALYARFGPSATVDASIPGTAGVSR